jgi:glucose/arabinose dehydrogenase
MSLELTQEFSFWVSLKPPIDFGAGPLGQRIYVEVTGGEATGARFKARAVGGAGDWVTVGSDGLGRIDVRLQFETDDNAYVYVQYFGLLELNEVAAQALAAGAGTAYEDQYFRTTPRFETGDPRYAWLNQSVFVAKGRLRDGLGVEYEVYRVE